MVEETLSIDTRYFEVFKREKVSNKEKLETKIKSNHKLPARPYHPLSLRGLIISLQVRPRVFSAL